MTWHTTEIVISVGGIVLMFAALMVAGLLRRNGEPMDDSWWRE